MTRIYQKKISELFSMNEKIVLITGACGFLGQEMASVFLQNNAKVIFTDLDTDKNKSIANKYVDAFKNSVWWFPIDITKTEEIEQAVKVIYEKCKKIDVLINNAAIDSPHSKENPVSFENYPLEEWKKMLDVNLTGAFLCSKIIGGKMAENAGGAIINISSIYGIVSPDQSLYKISENEKTFTKSPAYGASKAALHNLTKYLAAYFGDKIRANTLVLGGIKKESLEEKFQEKYSSRTPMKRMMDKKEIAGPILFLASDASSYISGAEIVCDGGFTIW